MVNTHCFIGETRTHFLDILTFLEWEVESEETSDEKWPREKKKSWHMYISKWLFKKLFVKQYKNTNMYFLR